MSSGSLRFVSIFAVSALPAFCGSIFSQTNLVSDIPGEALITDPSLVNPWGLSDSSSSPWWVSDNGTGLSTVYTGAGAKVGITVTVPPPVGGTSSAPTGQVFNSTADFKVGGANSNFIFATENGTISARTTGTTVTLEVDNSAAGAVYKGLAIGNNGLSNFLYAANFNSGNIDVFNTNFAPATLTGNFTDPTLPAGYAPFNVENIGGVLYVTYALQDAAKHDDVSGPGHGYLDEFDTNGNFIERLISSGPLDSPWGLALAPSDFGTFGGDLLVGNFGDGMINVFNPSTGILAGDLQDADGDPIVDEGLWGLAFGNGAMAGATDTLYFTAGIPGPGQVEDHGLFGDIVLTPEPGTVLMAMLGFGGLAVRSRRRQKS
jgi:uncharacterized protein (TIGR03118 family)